MRIAFAPAVLALLLLATERAPAQDQTWYWCGASRAYYPTASTCPVPWLAVSPGAVSTPSPSPSPSWRQYYNPDDPGEGEDNYSNYGG